MQCNAGSMLMYCECTLHTRHNPILVNLRTNSTWLGCVFNKLSVAIFFLSFLFFTSLVNNLETEPLPLEFLSSSVPRTESIFESFGTAR